MARELWIGRYTNYPDKQAGVLARDFLQESQILIFAACSHFQLITGLRFFRLAFMVGLIKTGYSRYFSTETGPSQLFYNVIACM